MGKNRKPRKQHKARAVDVPMMPETRDRLALSMHMAVEALIMAPSVETYNSLSTKLCTLSNVGMNCRGYFVATAAVQDICDRYERIGKVGVSATEAEALRSSVGDLDRMLASIPVNKLVAAEALTAAHCAEMGI